MTRAKISEYSATANDNTDVNGINIAEGCPPSSMNNMGREIMAALKRFQVGSDGDGVTVGGSLVVSGSTSVNTFNVDVISEKTSAAGVTVDGVLLKDSQVSTDQINEKTSATGVTIDGVLLKDSGVVTGAGTVSAPVYSTTGDLNTGIFFPAADTIGLAAGGVEAARLVSGLLSVPANSTAASAVRLFEDTDNGTNYVDIIAPSAITSDRTITLPDNTGTIITTASTFAGTGPAFSAYADTTQNFTTGVFTKVNLGTELFDTNSNFASSRFTPTVAGYYQINGSVNVQGSSSITRLIASIYKNGSEYYRGNDIPLGTHSCVATGVVYLDGSTDYVELYTFVTGTGLVISFGLAQTYLSGSLVRAS